MVINRFGGWLDCPDYFFFWNYHGNNSIFNISSYQNPAMDKLIDAARFAPGSRRRYAQNVRGFVEHRHAARCPSIPIAQPLPRRRDAEDHRRLPVLALPRARLPLPDEGLTRHARAVLLTPARSSLTDDPGRRRRRGDLHADPRAAGRHRRPISPARPRRRRSIEQIRTAARARPAAAGAVRRYVQALASGDLGHVADDRAAGARRHPGAAAGLGRADALRADPVAVDRASRSASSPR